jgi:HSP20 family protein
MTMFDPFSELDRLAGTVFRPGPRFMPVDLYRDGERYVLTADLPGIDPGSVEIDVDGQLLTIRAERSVASNETVKWVSQERPHGSYLRQFSLGEGVDPDGISAEYDHGVLTVTMPISERAKPRKIEVMSGASSDQKTITL